jgi:hypothetical protein
MWNLIRNNNIKIIFYILIIVTFIFIFNFNRGLELTDDSYMLLYSLYPDDTLGRLTNFGLIGNFLLKISGNDIYFFRILGFCLLLSSSILACTSVQYHFKNKKILFFDNYYLLASTALTGSLCYYKFWAITPSYNMYNIVGSLIFFSGICYYNSRNTNLRNLKSFFMISFGLLICFISKPPTAIFLSFALITWNFFLYKEIFLKNITLIFLLTTGIFISYFSIFFISPIYLMEDLILGYDLIKTTDARYNIFQLFFFSIKWIVKHVIVDYWYVFIIQILLGYYTNIKKNNFIILLYFLLIVLIAYNLNIFLFSLFIHLLFFYKKIDFKKKEHLIVLLISFVIFFISFGTNTNIDQHMQSSAIFYFILIIYFFNIYFKNYEYKNLFVIILFSSFTFINIYDNVFKPRRYDENILRQIYPVQIPKFKNKIYVDTFTKNYLLQVREVQLLLKKKNYEYLIDYTGRNPGLNLLFGYKFISRPWWSSGYNGSDDKVKKILKISNKKNILNSLIIIEKRKDLRKLKLNNFQEINVNFHESYKIIGNIKVKGVKKMNVDLQVWEPR